jgi:TolA-binding protein
MSDGNDKILEKLGELSGLMQATREDVHGISDTQKEHGTSIQTLASSLQVLQTSISNIDNQTKRELSQVNDKLGRDYERINVLEKDKNVANGIEDYKGKKRVWWQWALGIIGAGIGILISINQLVDLVRKVDTTKINSSSVYASPLKDSLKTYKFKPDTIRGK